MANQSFGSSGEEMDLQEQPTLMGDSLANTERIQWLKEVGALRAAPEHRSGEQHVRGGRET